MITAFLAWLVGMALQLQQVQLWSAWCYGVLFSVSSLSFLSVLYVWRKRVTPQACEDMHVNACFSVNDLCRYGGQVAICLSVMVAGFACAGLEASYRMSQALDPADEQQDILVTGRVDELPQMQSGRWRFVFQVDESRLLTDQEAGQGIELPERLLLSWYFKDTDPQSVPEIRTGQRWALPIRVKAPHGSVNLHTFDYELWLWSQNIGAVGYVRTAKNSPEPQFISDEHFYASMSGWREFVRASIMQTVAEPRQANLIVALTLGDQRAISQADWDVFRITGVAHLVSISGLHITMMAWVMYGVVGWLWRRSTRLMLKMPAHVAAMIAGLLCAALYAWFTGWGIPAQRTVMMLATVVILRCIGIRWPWYVVWLFIAVVIVTLDPWALLQAGFWLSFVAVGVLFAQSSRSMQSKGEQALENELKRMQLMLPRPLWQRLFLKVWESLRELLLVQLRISVALAPLTLLLFQQVSVVGLVANMFAIPWVTFLMVPLSIMGIVFHPLWHIAAWAGEILLAVLDVCASLPMAVIHGASPPLGLALVGMVGALIMVLPQLKWQWRGSGVLLLLPVFLWQAPTPAQGEFEAMFLDVGQGSAVLIRTANHTLLYDTGPKYSEESNAGAVLVVPALNALGVSLDRIVVSHADTDHAGGLEAVWRSYPEADLLYTVKDDVLFGAKDLSPHVLGERRDCLAGLNWQWDGVEFEVLHPFTTEVQNRRVSTNAQSCVLRIVTGGDVPHAVLLTGDIEVEQEKALVVLAQKAEMSLSADVLLMPHHGSRTSSSTVFLSAVDPVWAVAQTGYLNRYNHSVPEVVERYHAQGAKVVNTTSCGAAIWRSDAPREMNCARKMRARYWRHRQGHTD